ncbi:hypothetical protein [Rheinheimera hassiensis]|uniref:hypothetical protein n=1 Tax=Rheinheimera hassiensis TaxID=1193627 RepID=UPI001F067652|nr:hypothetical protein [Rheinheimera hassiensis]
MSSYELIKDLEKKLGLYKDNHLNLSSSAPTRIQEMLAECIFSAQIYPSSLTRNVVKALIEERQPWPTIDGGEYCLAYPVKIEDLEVVGLLRFPNDNLCIQRATDSSLDMPNFLRNQLNALSFLHAIRLGYDDLVSPHLRLHKKDIEPNTLTILSEYLISEGEYVRISFDHNEIFGVGTCLWKSLRATTSDPNQAFTEYTIKMCVATDRSYVFEIDFEHGIDIDEFLECAFNHIVSDTSLRDSWRACATEMAISHNGIESLTQIQAASTSAEAIYHDTLNLNPLAQVIDNLASRQPCTLLEGKIWFEDGWLRNFHEPDSISARLVWLIIKHEKNVYSIENSFPITRKLIALSSNAPKLLNLLFADISLPAYLCFLLSNRPTNHIGLIELYRNIERSARPISDKVAYERIWQDLVWMQGLEVYCYSHEKLDHRYATEALEAICEMVAWFTRREISRNSRTLTISDTRLPSLKNTIKSIIYINESGCRQNLFDNHLLLLGDIINRRLTDIHKQSNPTPIGEWIVLFWCLELASKHSNQTSNAITKKLCEVLISSYLRELQMRISNQSHSSDDPLALDELSWSQLLLCASKGLRFKWILALEAYYDQEVELSHKDTRNLNSAVRLHFRVLLQLYRGAQDYIVREHIATELVMLVQQFGFAHDKYSGAFNYSNDNSDYSPLRLWPTFCELTNEFTDKPYNNFLIALSSSAVPMSALFILLEKTDTRKRRESIETIIKSRTLEKESPNWVPEIFDIVIKAANNGYISIAKYFLGSIWKNAHKVHKNKIDELTGKIELKEIFENVALPVHDKIESIRNFKIEYTEKEVVRAVQEFKSYLIASLNMTIDNNTSVKQFAQLVKTSPTLQNATGLIKSALSASSTDESDKQLEDYFKIWTDIFKKSHQTSTNVVLPDDDLRCILQLCLKISRLDEFSEFWGIATSRQRESYQFAAERAEYLIESGRRKEAISYINELLNESNDLPDAALYALNSIKKGLLDQQAPIHFKLEHPQTSSIKSTQEDLRVSWLRIRDLNAADQSQILMEPSNSIDPYLLQTIEQVGNELLMRSGNLLRKKAYSNSTSIIPLDDENMINDWLVSLIRQRMNFVSWKIHDQSRIGLSASEDGVGETDGWIQDGQGHLISIIEAFRLGKTIDKQVIRKHLDKVCGYNSTGASPIFIVVYTSTEDFPKLCSEYENYVSELKYKGFDIDRPNNFRRKEMKIPQTRAWYYEETRYLNGEPINMYHQLLNLKSPLP